MNRAYRAMEFIGDDLIERAEMVVVVKSPSGIWMRGIAIAACLCLIVGGACYAGIWYWSGTDEPPVPDEGGGSTLAQTSSETNSTIDGMSIYTNATMEDIYPYSDADGDRHIFAKMRFEEFSETYWGEFYEKCILIKATIVEDYYDTLESGTQITLCFPLYLRRSSETGEEVYYDVESVIDFLSQFDSVFVFTRGIAWETFSYLDADGNILLNEDGNVIWFRDWVYYLRFKWYDVLPVSNEKLDLDSLKTFWDEWGVNYYRDDVFSDEKFWKYIQNGMDESVFAENIRENKERQIQKSS